MRKLIPFLLVAAVACTRNSSAPDLDAPMSASADKTSAARTAQNSIVGNWQRIARYVSDGTGKGAWTEPGPNGNSIRFAENGTFDAGGHWYLYRFSKYRVISEKQIEFSGAGATEVLEYGFTPSLEIYYKTRERSGDRFVKM